MKRAKWNRVVERSVMKFLDTKAKKHGLPEVRHAANKWSGGQQAKLRLAKARAALEEQLADVNRRLKS